MEGLHCLKFLLEQDDLLCKMDLKETYFVVPLTKNSQKFVRFQWSGNIYEFLCLCFRLGSASRIFTKLLKVPIALLRRVTDLMERTLPKILMARDTLIFLMQYLGFQINLKKSVLHPVKQIEFLGLVIYTSNVNSHAPAGCHLHPKINNCLSKNLPFHRHFYLTSWQQQNITNNLLKQ